MIDLNDKNISYLIISPEILGISQMENNHRTNMFLNMLMFNGYKTQSGGKKSRRKTRKSKRKYTRRHKKHSKK